MSEIILNATIKPRSDTKENWESNNPTLKENEIGVEKSYVEDGISFGPRLKIGTGTTAWNSLQYLSVGQSVGPTSSIIGLKNEVTHEYVSLIGDSLKSDNDYQTIVGRANTPITESVNFETGKPLFCVGNGKISDSTNGVTSDSDRSNAMYVDEYGNIVASKNVYINGNKNITDFATYTHRSNILDPTKPLTYMVSDIDANAFSKGKYIKVTKQSDGSFLLENTSSSSTGEYYDNSIGLCTAGAYKLGLSLQLKQKDYQSDSVYCKVIKTQFGTVQQGIAYPETLSSTTSFVSVNPPDMQTEGYRYYYINVPYGCSCYVRNMKITINDETLYQYHGSVGMMTPYMVYKLNNIPETFPSASEFEWEEF